MSEWQEKTLGLVADIQTGPFGSQLKNEQYITGGTPVVTVEHIRNFRIIDFNYPSVTEADKDRLSKYILHAGDIVFTRVGSVDLSAYTQPHQQDWMFSSRMLRVRPNKELDARYLSYFFQQKSFRENLLSIAVGATMPSINTEILESVIVTYPPLPEQKAIASILSSLDDKIDLLHRQNKTLEAMAETLFRQWFVEEAGEDWELRPLGEFVTVKRGGSPRPIHEYLSETGLRWLKISDVTKIESPFIFEIKEYIKEEGLSKTTLLKAGTLVLSNSATPAIPKILQVDSCIHDGWLHFPKSYFSNEFLYLLFKKIRPELLAQGNGSIFTNLKTDILKEYPIPIADKESLQGFDEQVKPMFWKMLENTKQIQTLENLRDTLLPKLMSGEIRITDT